MKNRALLFAVLSVAIFIVIATVSSSIDVLNVAATLMIFAVPAITYALLQENALGALRLNRNASGVQWLMVGMFAIMVFPSINLLGEMNGWIVFPESMSELEQSLREANVEIEQSIRANLAGAGWSGLLLAILTIAVMPAVCEEMFFRGFLQGWLGKKMNIHLAIVVVSVVFSAVHFDFYGFIPRLLIAVMYGYVFYYTGSLWTTILTHFINNASIVGILYLQENYNMLDSIDRWGTEGGSMVIAVVACIFCIGMIVVLKGTSKNSPNKKTMTK